MRPSPKSEMMLYHKGEWELEAHTRSSCSTHGYFESWKDELLTPSQCWDSEISYFVHWYWPKHIVIYLRNSSYFCHEYLPWIWSRKYENFQFHQKQKILRYILFMKLINLIFYWILSKLTSRTRALKTSENGPKMSPKPRFHDILQRVRSHIIGFH